MGGSDRITANYLIIGDVSDEFYVAVTVHRDM